MSTHYQPSAEILASATIHQRHAADYAERSRHYGSLRRRDCLSDAEFQQMRRVAADLQTMAAEQSAAAMHLMRIS